MVEYDMFIIATFTSLLADIAQAASTLFSGAQKIETLCEGYNSLSPHLLRDLVVATWSSVGYINHFSFYFQRLGPSPSDSTCLIQGPVRLPH